MIVVWWLHESCIYANDPRSFPLLISVFLKSRLYFSFFPSVIVTHRIDNKNTNKLISSCRVLVLVSVLLSILLLENGWFSILDWNRLHSDALHELCDSFHKMTEAICFPRILLWHDSVLFLFDFPFSFAIKCLVFFLSFSLVNIKYL